MKGEIPVCKRCCFCLPLRYGLIVWGYLKLIFLSFFIPTLCVSIYQSVTWYNKDGSKENGVKYIVDLSLSCTAFIIMITEFLMTIVFVIGGHMKNVKLLKVFFFYYIGVWVVSILLTVIIIGLALKTWLTREMSFYAWLFHIKAFLMFFFDNVIQTYFLILLRSEIMKLKSSCEFRFQNNATEAECRMKCGEELPEEGAQDL